ncbi:hypothetical protein MMC22_006124 [Lobaria immixta]|nr:hypothetical protein [Lobaria immixta]
MLIFASLITLSGSPPPDWVYPPLPLAVGVIHQFPIGTWIEDLAIQSNGKILTTALSSPEIFHVDNRGKIPIQLVHTFANATSCTGITRMGHDVFYVIVGNFSLSTFSAVAASWSVYRVHFHPHLANLKRTKVSLVASFPDSIMLNGVMVLNKRKKWLLVSDSGAGVVYRLEAKTGKVIKVLEDPLMKPEKPSGIGINGIKFKTGHRSKKGHNLYFTNSDRNILAHMIVRNDGTSMEPASVIAHVDDPHGFGFSGYNHAVIAQNGVDLLGRVTNNTLVTLAGSPSKDSRSTLLGPTSVQFGEVKPFLRGWKSDWMIAYISTNGGTAQYLMGNVTRGGTISAVEISGYH